MNLPFDSGQLPLFVLLLKMGAIFVVLRMLARGFWLRALVWWPSTLMHELAHFFLGCIFHADPVGISLWPRRIAGTSLVQFGHVTFRRLSWWKAVPVALAPLLLFPLGCYLVAMVLLHGHTGWMQLLFIYGAVQCLGGCWPSSQDWALARPGIWSAFILVLLVAAGSAALAHSR